MKKVWKNIIIVLVFVAAIILLYQAICIGVVYKPRGLSTLSFQSTISVEKTTTCDLDYPGLNICIPEGFSLVDTEENLLSYKDSSDRYLVAGPVDGDLEYRILEFDDHVDAKKLMKKYHFNDMVDLLHYYEKHQLEVFTLFSKVSDARDYYIIWNLANSVPSGEIYYIEGDYHGYLIKQEHNYTVYLYHGKNQLYNISFGNAASDDTYFNGESVSSILSTVSFED